MKERPITPQTTLGEIEDLCEYQDFCDSLRKIREAGQKKYKKQSFDYLFAVLLRGCDEKNCEQDASGGITKILHLAKWSYCTYVVSKYVDKEDPKAGTGQFTWASNCAKAAGRKKSTTKLDDGSDVPRNAVFARLEKGMTLGEVREKFQKATEPAFMLPDNKGKEVLEAIDAVCHMEIPATIV